MLSDFLFRVICIFITIILGTFGFNLPHNNENNFSSISIGANQNNHIVFNNNVHAFPAQDIQSGFSLMNENNGVYSLTYKNKFPDGFTHLNKDDIFCVYPDKNSHYSYFAQGFCGKVISTDNNVIKFTMPTLTEVFSEISISSFNGAINGISFTPEKHISKDVSMLSASTNLPCARTEPQNLDRSYSHLSAKKQLISTAEPQNTPESDENSFTLKSKNTKADFNCKTSDKKSVQDDYTILCKQLKLNIDYSDAKDVLKKNKIKGSVTLDYPAVKTNIDYKKDNDGNVTLNNFDLGFEANQKVDVDFCTEKEVGLDKLNADTPESEHIIEISDVTESEKGKIVLGTYLIGMEAALPILENDKNKVNSLSLGFAIQLSLTASGKLSLDYNVSESGFLQTEVNKDGLSLCNVKGYDYPNPAVSSNKATETQESSIPSVTSKITGKADVDLAFGADIGVCILGMIPIKLSNNILECEVSKSFKQNIGGQNDTISDTTPIADDSVSSIIFSSNSHLKVNLGVKVNLGFLQSDNSISGSCQLFKHVYFQYPTPVTFSHSQCGFGGVFMGEKYDDTALQKTFNDFEKDSSKYDFVPNMSNPAFATAVSGIISNISNKSLNLSDFINESSKKAKVSYFTSGVIYIRDADNKIINVIVTGDSIHNSAGFHTGLTDKKTDQIYSAPQEAASVKIKLSPFIIQLLNLCGCEYKNGALSYRTYYSTDSSEEMQLIFDENTLKMIILTSK